MIWTGISTSTPWKFNGALAYTVPSTERRRVFARLGISIGLVTLLLSTLLLGQVFAGTTGKLSGRVTKQNGQPTPYALIRLTGPVSGNVLTDSDGYYNVLQLTPGEYEVAVTLIGYQTQRVQGLLVSADQTTRQEFVLVEAPIEMGEIVVQAERPIVDVHLTSTVTSVSGDEIDRLPVQELQDVVNLQAGVVDGHFRGGRLGEVQYQVDGVSINNPFNNESSLTIDRSLLQEVQVISGVFDAEYGQAMSGVVNAILKEGEDKVEWSGELYGGGYVFPDNDDRILDDEVQPARIMNAQIGVSGPLPLSGTTFLLSGRRYVRDSHVYGERLFRPNDNNDTDENIFTGTGDGERVPLGFSREWSGLAKVTQRPSNSIKVSYQFILHQSERRTADYQYRLNPDGKNIQKQISYVHGLDWRHTLGAASYYEVAVRQNYLDYTDRRYDDLFDSRYDDAGPPVSDDNYEDGAFVQGVQFDRFAQKTNGAVVKVIAVSQLRHDHLGKAGLELLVPKLRFGAPGHLVYTLEGGVETLRRYVDAPPDYPGLKKYEPVAGAVFAQDQIEWSDFTVRAGLRCEYFDSRSSIPSDLANPANSILGAPESRLVETDPKLAFAPRLGMAYPITQTSGIHFAYGHFYQYPPLGDIFGNADYSKLEGLQASDPIEVMGNPDVKAEHTVQYELGYRQALSPDVGFEIATFYKDIRRLLGVEFLTTYNGAEYARLTNVDFGSVVGFTASFDGRAFGPVATTVDYTWQLAQGNSSDPRETATRQEDGEDARPRFLPLNWDQRHTLNLTGVWENPGVFSISSTLQVNSGQPYTPILDTGFGAGLNTNSGRKPTSAVLDFRAERSLHLAGMDVAVFSRLINVLDTDFVNGFVFNSTGSPYYSRFPQADERTLADPTRFNDPRRIEIGMTVGSLP